MYTNQRLSRSARLGTALPRLLLLGALLLSLFGGGATSSHASERHAARTAALSTGILDTFNRANGAVGSKWVSATGSGFYTIASKRLDVQVGGPLLWKDSFGTSQEAFLTLQTVDRASPMQGLLLKVQPGEMPDSGAIGVYYDARAKAVRVAALRLGAKSWTSYLNMATTFASGDQLAAQALANGTVEVYKNGSLVKSVTLSTDDGRFFNSKGGRIGVWMLDAPNAVLDDFGGGTIAVAPPTPTTTSTKTRTSTPTKTAVPMTNTPTNKTRTSTPARTPTKASTSTPTNTFLPTITSTNTSVPPTTTSTNTTVPPTATSTRTSTSTLTNTTIPPTATSTRTSTNTPTTTPTGTAVPPTSTATTTPTDTAVPSTETSTRTSTSTPTSTSTSTPTNTPVPPTNTAVPPTKTPSDGLVGTFLTGNATVNSSCSEITFDVSVQAASGSSQPRGTFYLQVNDGSPVWIDYGNDRNTSVTFTLPAAASRVRVMFVPYVDNSGFNEIGISPFRSSQQIYNIAVAGSAGCVTVTPVDSPNLVKTYIQVWGTYIDLNCDTSVSFNVQAFKVPLSTVQTTAYQRNVDFGIGFSYTPPPSTAPRGTTYFDCYGIPCPIDFEDPSQSTIHSGGTATLTIASTRNFVIGRMWIGATFIPDDFNQLPMRIVYVEDVVQRPTCPADIDILSNGPPPTPAP